MTEYWDLLDENREPLGLLHRRGDALPAGARHLCVEIITVWEGRILTTLRHPQKHNGGYWEVTTGSALAGEDSLLGVCLGLLKQRYEQAPTQEEGEQARLAAELVARLLEGEEVVLP